MSDVADPRPIGRVPFVDGAERDAVEDGPVDPADT
jgi:hypothetical protein